MTARCAIVLLALVCFGCNNRQHLDESYGSRRNGKSVNGLSAFSDLFKQAGHRVRSWRYLSPSLEDADVLVWAPDDTSFLSTTPGSIGTPSAEAVAWLDDWLQYGDTPRTLIYVGRDWEAAAEYWAAAQPMAPAAQQPEFGSRLRTARSDATSRLSAKVEPLECDWFRIERGNTKTTVQKLAGPLSMGENPFAPDVDAGKAKLEHWASLHTDLKAETLLADDTGHPLVREIAYEASWLDSDSRLILVENGGFVLNGALVNHERRKLAGRLVDHIGPPEQRVVFLETGPAPIIRDTDPNPRPPTGLELFTIWPIGAVLAQVAALFAVYACACWPIFGVPRRLEQPSLTDFSRHVHALARLLVTTRDRAYAVTQLNTYFHTAPDQKAIPQQGSAGASPSRSLQTSSNDNA